MKCNRARELMGPYLYGELTADEMCDLRSHIDACSECREDVESRSEVLAAIPDAAPSLTDEERDRMAWYVQGAVRPVERSERSWSFGLSRAYACGAAVMLLIGFVLGSLVGSRSPHSRPVPATSTANLSTTIREDNGRSTVESRQPTTEDSAELQDGDNNPRQPGGTTAMDIVRSMAPLATTNRSDEQRKPGRIIVLDEPAPIVQTDSATEKPQTQEKPNATTLPKATGLNDVQKTPAGR